MQNPPSDRCAVSGTLGSVETLNEFHSTTAVRTKQSFAAAEAMSAHSLVILVTELMIGKRREYIAVL